MKHTILPLLIFVGLGVRAQWVDRGRMSDSLVRVAHEWNVRGSVYADSAIRSGNLKDMERLSDAAIKCSDSAIKYIVWAEEENVDAIKEALFMEGFKMDMEALNFKKVDSAYYKHLDSLYKRSKGMWIQGLKSMSHDDTITTIVTDTPIHSDIYYHMGRNKGAALLPQHIRYEGDSIEGNTAFLDARERYWKNKLDTTKRPLKIKCPCPCHDGVAGFFHCWKDCCKWPNEPRLAPSPRPDTTHQRIHLNTN